ncbi:MAG: D-alanine--D-alanine ligase family protein [Candidatus Nanopelagicales bacterium]
MAPGDPREPGPARRQRVAVVFGGRSSEHAISCLSAGSVLRALDRARYDVVPVGITPSGRWVLAPDDPEILAIVGGVLPAVDSAGDAVALSLDPTSPGLMTAGGADVGALLAEVDVVFPVLHGPWGEDGTIQGLFELAGVPYVGSGVFASAAAMDKGHMKALFAAAGMAQAPYVVLTERDWSADRAGSLARVGELGSPVFVKPARAGSSVGITRLALGAEDGQDQLVDAIEHARTHDPRVVVEAAVVGAREVECGVLAGVDGVPRASVCAEIVVREGHEFYDFEAKYLEDAADLIVPAQLAGDVAERVRAVAVQAFEALACEGLARCDVFVRPDGEVLINEVNTMPGFTTISMYPRMWAASGVDFPELVDRLVQDAVRRGTGLR